MLNSINKNIIFILWFLKNLIIFLRVRKSLAIKDLRAPPARRRKSLGRNDLRLGDQEVALGVLGDQRVGLTGHFLVNHVAILRGDGISLPDVALRVQLNPLGVGEFLE